MIENTDLLGLYRTTKRIRSFEEHVAELHARGASAGSMLHLPIGEEGATAGVGAALKSGDSLATHHRGHAYFAASKIASFRSKPALHVSRHVARHSFRGAGHRLHWDQPEDTVALLAAGLMDRDDA